MDATSTSPFRVRIPCAALWLLASGLVGPSSGCAPDSQVNVMRAGGATTGGTASSGGAVTSTGGTGDDGDFSSGGAMTGDEAKGSGGNRPDGGPADAEPRTGGATDASAPDSPRPAAPCSDLDVDNGQVQPSYGPPLAFAQGSPGDLASAGPLEREASELTVPVQAASRTYGDSQTVPITAGTLPATAYVPRGDGPFPLVLVSPGFQANRTMYTTFLDHLASWGFIAVGIDTRSNALTASHDKEALELSQSVDWLLSSAPFKNRIDPQKLVVAGHSKGGKVAFFTAVLDPRVDVAIGWDPVNSGGPPCFVDPVACSALPVAPSCEAEQSGLLHLMRAETLVIGAPPDPLLAPDEQNNCVHFYRGAPGPAWLAVLDTGHAAWAANDDSPTIQLTKRIQLALLLTRFYGVDGLLDQLPNGQALAGQPLILDQRHK